MNHARVRRLAAFAGAWLAGALVAGCGGGGSGGGAAPPPPAARRRTPPPPANAAPTAQAQSATVAEDGTVNLTLGGTDPEGAALTFTVVQAPAQGTLTGTPPSVSYTPAANYAGSDSFTFHVSDGALQSSPATVSITVTAVNDAPTADAASASTVANTPVDLVLTGSDVEGAVLGFFLVTPPAHGTIYGLPSGSISYQPEFGYVGADSFTFRVDDGGLTSAPALVSLTIAATTNLPPTSANGLAFTNQEQDVVITFAGSDPEDGLPTEWEFVGGMLHGAFTTGVPTGNPPRVSAGTLTFTPDFGYVGTDTIEYRTIDSQGARSATSTVTVHIGPPRIRTLSPWVGDVNGGTALTIRGERFWPTATVLVGGLPATNVTVVDPTTITCDTPAGALGMADVTVENDPIGVETAPSAFFYEGFAPAVQVNALDPTETGVAEQTGPAVAHNPVNGDLAAVWLDQREGNGWGDIYISRFDGTWSPNVRVNQDQAPTSYRRDSPVAGYSGAELFVVWADARDPATNADLYVARSTDALTWVEARLNQDGATSPAEQHQPNLAVGPSGEVVVVWADTRNDPAGLVHDIYYARFDGTAWTEGLVSQTSTDKALPQVAVAADGSIAVAWHEARGATGFDVHCAISPSPGGTWTEHLVSVEPDPVNPEDQLNAAVTWSGTNVVVAWNASLLGGNEVVVSAYDGSTWTEDRPGVGLGIVGLDRFAHPRLAVDAIGLLWLAYQDFNRDAAVLWSSGPTWTAEVVNTQPTVDNRDAPVLAALNPGGVVVAWDDSRGGNHLDIHLAYTLGPGSGWTEERVGHDDRVDGPQVRPDIAVNPFNGVLSAVWDDERLGNPDVFAADSDDGGATWLTNRRTNQNAPDTMPQYSPRLAFDDLGQNACVVWADMRDYGTRGTDIYFAYYNGFGALEGRVNQDLGSATQFGAEVVFEPSGAVVVAWYDDRDDAGDIYVARSIDGGMTWSEHRVTTAAGRQVGPALVALQDGSLLVAWEDWRGGDADIRLARSTDQGVTWTESIVAQTVHFETEVDLCQEPGGGWVAVWRRRDASTSDPGDIHAGRSVDQGVTWTDVKVNPVLNTTQQWLARAAIDPDGAIVVTYESGGEVMLARSVDGGATWRELLIPPQPLSSGTLAFPAIAPGLGGVVLVWSDSSGMDSDIGAARAAFATYRAVSDDADGDGLPDGVERRAAAGGATTLIDSDNDTLADHQDPDADGDGVSDAVEGMGDGDGNGLPRFLDPGEQ